MNVEELRDYCLSLGVDVEEKMPFQAFKAAQGVLAFYVAGHMFCYFDVDKFTVVTLKCQQERIDELKEQYSAIGKPYNMSPHGWIGVDPANADSTLLRELTQNSYRLVKEKYTKRIGHRTTSATKNRQ